MTQMSDTLIANLIALALCPLIVWLIISLTFGNRLRRRKRRFSRWLNDFERRTK